MSTNEHVVPSLLELLRVAVNAALKQAANIKFNKQNPQHFLTLSLYGSIIEITQSCLELAGIKRYIAVPILLRSVLEAHVDLIITIKDKNYAQTIHASELKERIRVLKGAISNSNSPYFQYIISHMDVNQEMENLRKELNDLKKQNRVPLSVEDRFKLAGLGNEHGIIYWDLCLHSHNNALALNTRHVINKDTEYNVVFFNDKLISENFIYLDTLTKIVIDSTEYITNLFVMTNQEQIMELRQRLFTIRAQYNPPPP